MKNIQALRKLLRTIVSEDAVKANKLLDAVESDIKKLEGELSDALEEVDNSGFRNSTNLGLDTLNWSLENDNLAINQKMEAFIESTQKEYAVIPA